MDPPRNPPKRNTDPAKDKYGVTAGTFPGIEALRDTFDPSQLAQFNALMAFEANRLAEARAVLDDQDQQIALNTLSRHWVKQEAAGNPAAADLANTQRSSGRSGATPALEPEEPNNTEGRTFGKVSSFGIHPEVTNTRINSYLVTASHILSNRWSPAASVARAHASAQSAYELAHSVKDESMMARSQFYLGLTGLRSGSVKRALAHLQDATEVNPPYKEGTWARLWIPECEKIIDLKGEISIGTSVATSPGSSTASQDARQNKRGRGTGKHIGKGKAPVGGKNWSSAESSEQGSEEGYRNGPNQDSDDGPRDTPPASNSTTPERQRTTAGTNVTNEPKPKPKDIGRKKNTAVRKAGVAGASTTQQPSAQQSPTPVRLVGNERDLLGNAAAPAQDTQPPQGPPQAPPHLPRLPPPAFPVFPPHTALNHPPNRPLAGIDFLARNARADSPYTDARGEIQTPVPEPAPAPAPGRPDAKEQAEEEE